jgi:hypothetical protein
MNKITLDRLNKILIFLNDQENIDLLLENLEIETDPQDNLLLKISGMNKDIIKYILK